MATIKHDIIYTFISNVKGFNKGMRETGIEFRKHSTKLGALRKNQKAAWQSGARWSAQIRKMTHGFRGFRMEMLGVMFFGMGLQKFFSDLLAPAMKLTGLTELLSSVLAVLFLPIILKIMDWLLPWIDRIMNLSEATKIFIGKVVVWGAVIGGIIFLIGMFSLGIGSLIMAFGGLISILAIPLIAAFTAFGAIMSLVPNWLKGALTAILIFFGIMPIVKASNETVEEHGSIWQRIGDWISGAISKVIGWLDRLWDKFLNIPIVNALLTALGVDIDKLRNPLKFIKDKFEETFGAGVMATMEKTVKKVMDEVTGSVVGMVSSVADKIDERFPGVLDAFKDFNKSLAALIVHAPSLTRSLELIAGAINGIAKAFEFMSQHKKVMAWLGGALVGGGVGFAVGGPVGALIGAGVGGAGAMAAMNTKQTGGFIPHTGLYKMHAGEEVLQAGDTFNSSPIINVYGATGDDLVRQISEAVVRDLGTLSRR